MKILKRYIALMSALGISVSMYGQELDSIPIDEEPIDLELARMPVRRPAKPVYTVITIYDLERYKWFEEANKAKEAEKKAEKKVKKQKQVEGPRVSQAVIEANRVSQRKQTQEEVDANVEKYIAEARAKAPKHETYVPTFTQMARRVHDEEKMDQEQLMRFFNSRKEAGVTKFVPKSAPSMVERNSIYLYFEVPLGSRPGPMNIRVQYYADDKLDTEKVEFQINGEVYTLVPKKISTRKQGIFVSEWFDMQLEGDDKSLEEAMGYANYVRVKFIGKSFSHVKDLTREQVADLRRAYFLKKNYR